MNKLTIVSVVACSFVISCMGCSTTAKAPDVPLSRIDIGLKPYVDKFYAVCQKYNPNPESCTPLIKLTVRVKQTEENILGVCYVYDKPYEYVRVIHINPQVVLNETLLTVVMYHELMHCVLGYQHFDDQLDIMNSYLNDESTAYFLKYWDFFLQTVFDREGNTDGQ